MTFKKGQLILLDYTAKIKDSGEVFETTNEDDAKKHSIHDPNIKYMPKLVSVGEAWVLKGLDDALPETKAGEKKTIEVPAEKGFGARDKGKVRMIPLRKLGEDAEKVSVYECGFDPFGDSRQKFEIRFFLVAILFIIFDLEISFLFP